jgi:hypothetical protein
MANRVRYEQRSALLALQTYLESAGWAGINALTYRDGYQSEETIEPPMVAITFPPSRIKVIQMGRVSGQDRVYTRRMQVDVYMEDEPRTQALLDDIMDFMDEICIFIENENNQELGTLICHDSESIYADTVPPFMANPKNLRYRGVVRGEFEAHYPGVP